MLELEQCPKFIRCFNVGYNRNDRRYCKFFQENKCSRLPDRPQFYFKLNKKEFELLLQLLGKEHNQKYKRIKDKILHRSL